MGFTGYTAALDAEEKQRAETTHYTVPVTVYVEGNATVVLRSVGSTPEEALQDALQLADHNIGSGYVVEIGPCTDVRPVKLAGEWCTCDGDTGFHSYPEDGACPCGVYKHHVHGLCGHVTQVG